MSKRLTLATASAIALTAVAAAPAFAQDDATTVRLEEIVVTANRREESAQRVPISVSAISASAAEARGVVDLQSIATAVPGLTTARTAVSNSPYIRGVGNPAPEISNEPSVATYIDNVYIPFGGATAFELGNIERVEVLKGPQGTLFGRNATGGVIHVITKDPTSQPSMDASVGYATYKTFSGKFYGTTGITNDLSANLALSYSDRNKGWGTNLLTGNDSVKASSYVARAKLLWTPGADTRVVASLSTDGQIGNPGFARAIVPGNFVVFPVGGVVPHVGGFYDTNLTFDPTNRQFTNAASVKVDQGIGDLTLVSITAYSKYKQKTYYDLDISPAASSATNLTGYNESWTQELQLKSAPDAKLQWIVGGFYFNGASGYRPQIAVAKSVSATTGAITTTNRFIYVGIDSNSIAAFGQATYEFLPDTHLTVGGRYTRDHRQEIGNTAINGVIQPASFARGATTWKKATWRLALDHQFTDEFMAYASVNTGFKSGYYNPSSYVTPANPETLTAYETGFKSQWLDNRLRLNASAYYYDYKNMQVTVIITPAGGVPTSFTQNAAKARVKGFDLEMVAVPTDALTITGGLSAMSAHYKSYPNGNHFSPAPLRTCAIVAPPAGATGGQNSVAGCDLSGNEMIQAPPFTANLSGTYKVATSVGDLALNVTYFHTDHWWFEPDNSLGNKAYDLVNASVRWTAADGRWGASLWGRNLTKTKYFLSGASTSAAKYYAAAEPRTYGVTLSMHIQ